MHANSVEYKLHLHCFFACCRNISHTYGSLVRIVTIIRRLHFLLYALYLSINNFSRLKITSINRCSRRCELELNCPYILLDFRRT